MDKGKIQTFSDKVREKLLQETKQRAAYFGITKDQIHEVDREFEDSIIINGKIFDKKIKKQRNNLVKGVQNKGFDNTIDEVTYTWFNRFIALKYMEVNDYIPVKVFSSRDAGKTEPDLITDATNLTFLNLDKEYILTLKDQDNTEELYKYLIIKLCNWLHEIMPFLFEKIEDYTELLFPEKLLHTDSIVRDLNDIIPIEDWKEVEIIGWIYQDYIAPRKDKVFADLKKNIKISKENIPAATQLFTPKWIVKYMVENSLGRLWLESNPNPNLQSKWKYYIDQEFIPPEEKTTNPESITVLDPAMGSGHILVYAFEVLYHIYREQGYPESDIAPFILNKNLYGLEIDDRATQLAGFALMMKARSYDKDLFNKAKNLKLNLATIEETNSEASFTKEDYPELHRLWYQYLDAKNFGSILVLESFDHDKLMGELQRLQRSGKVEVYGAIPILEQLIFQHMIMDSKYNCLITNPPYMGRKGMNEKLRDYAKNNYPDSKTNLFAMFIEKNLHLVKKSCLVSMITMQNWMFTSSFNNLRNKLLFFNTIKNMVHLGPGAFDSISGEVVSTTAFVINNSIQKDMKSTYISLIDGNDETEKNHILIQSIHTPKNLPTPNLFRVSSNDLNMIPDTPIAYWVSDKIKGVFSKGIPLGSLIPLKAGMSTGDNTIFQRHWFEIKKNNCSIDLDLNNNSIDSNIKWYPCHSGGEFRKWFGNHSIVVNWLNDGYNVKHFKDDNGRKKSAVRNTSYYFKEGFTWSKIGSGHFAVRYSPSGFLFDDTGRCGFPNKKDFLFVISFLNTKLTNQLLRILTPTLSFTSGEIAKLPLIFPRHDQKIKIHKLVDHAITISRREWNSRETSWDFKQNELLKIRSSSLVADAFDIYCDYWQNQFFDLQENEEQLNRIFIDIYDLADELASDVSFDDITILKDEGEIVDNEIVFNKDVVVKQFLSYAIGCMFGRYSLDKPGLVLANQGETLQEYLRQVPEPLFMPDDDNIIPILDEEYFTDDIVGRFREFLKVTFGNETLSQNLDFIADALGRTGQKSSEEVIRNYFLKDFFKDHCKMYKKRPIYWLFSSDKDKAFNALIYMHRYNKDTVGKIRVDYLHKLQGMIEGQLATMQNLPNDPRERKKAEKKVAKLKKQMEEMRKYEEELKHVAENPIEIDLDDGVKVNYAKFGNLLQKI